MKPWKNNLNKKIKVTNLSLSRKVRLYLSAIRKSKYHLDKIIRDYIVSYKQSDPIEKIVQKNLIERNMTISVAESCTGGFLSHLLTKHPNASNIFKGAIICYNADSKIDLLGIDSKIIEKYSVVSEEVAKSMAKSVNAKFKSTFTIATTGNAGPTKDKTNADIGVVCIAITIKNKVFARTFNFGGQRNKVIEKACYKALEWLLKIIKKSKL